MTELATLLSDRTSAAVVDAVALERTRAGLEAALARAHALANACDDDSST